MIRNRIFCAPLALCLLALGTFGGTTAQAQDAIQTGLDIQEAFRAYQTAVLEDQGSDAAKLVSQGTIAYFEDAREMALYGTLDELESRTFTDRLQIVLLRHRVPLKKLETFSPEEIFAFAVDNGWVGKRSIGTLDVGTVRLEGGAAMGQALRETQPTDLELRFVYEEENWKLDLLPLLAVGNERFSQLAEQQQLTGEELILGIIGNVTGSEVSRSIFDPPLTRAE
ncbi:MAG: hypothetical protein K0U98_16805 [Deltaproteobacteria bacterium]|nr:hypothetical protein [Deltaproteobacteria bacterium]